MPKKSESWSAVGRRKSSVARVSMSIGKGEIKINNRPIENYFGRSTSRMVMKQTLDVLNLVGKYDIHANVIGGGLSGQAGAIRHGLARVLQKVDPDLHLALKQAGMLTRDSRQVERKKYGQPGARKKFQFSKR